MEGERKKAKRETNLDSPTDENLSCRDLVSLSDSNDLGMSQENGTSVGSRVGSSSSTGDDALKKPRNEGQRKLRKRWKSDQVRTEATKQ